MNIRYSEVQVRSIEDSYTEKVEDVQFTSPQSLPMQGFYFAQFTQQISAVSTGAVAGWCENLAQLIPGQTQVSTEKSVAKANDQLSQKLELQEVDSVVQTQRRNVQAAGNRLLRIYRQRSEELSNGI